MRISSSMKQRVDLLHDLFRGLCIWLPGGLPHFIPIRLQPFLFTQQLSWTVCMYITLLLQSASTQSRACSSQIPKLKTLLHAAIKALQIGM